MKDQRKVNETSKKKSTGVQKRLFHRPRRFRVVSREHVKERGRAMTKIDEYEEDWR